MCVLCNCESASCAFETDTITSFGLGTVLSLLLSPNANLPSGSRKGIQNFSSPKNAGKPIFTGISLAECCSFYGDPHLRRDVFIRIFNHGLLASARIDLARRIL